MDVIAFLCVSLGSRTVKVADAHIHRLVSVVKMATVLEECTTQEQHYVMRFFVDKRTQCKGHSLRNSFCLW
jgi:hypothetical protein